MASKKSRSKSPASQAEISRSLRDALKFMKAKGFYKGDLRKTPTRYALKKALAFVDAAKSPDDYVSIKVGKGAKNVTGPRIAATGNNRVLVAREYHNETIRYSKKNKVIMSTRTRRGETIQEPLAKVETRQGQWLVPLYRSGGKEDFVPFSNYAEAVAFINEYAKRSAANNAKAKAVIKSWIKEITFEEGETEDE